MNFTLEFPMVLVGAECQNLEWEDLGDMRVILFFGLFVPMCVIFTLGFFCSIFSGCYGLWLEFKGEENTIF